jgi:hypothetical protein
MTKCQSSLENFRKHNSVFVGVKDLQKILLLPKLSLQPTDYYRKVRACIAVMLTHFKESSMSIIWVSIAAIQRKCIVWSEMNMWPSKQLIISFL